MGIAICLLAMLKLVDVGPLHPGVALLVGVVAMGLGARGMVSVAKPVLIDHLVVAGVRRTNHRHGFLLNACW